MEGRVIKGIGGFYYVSDGTNVTMGNARGNLKKGKDMLYVGDIVDYDLRPEDGDCIIKSVRERKNFLSRPPVSNLDMLVIVFAAASPAPNIRTIDKLTVAALSKNIDVAICITKADLVTEDVLTDYVHMYEKAFPVVTVDNTTGRGTEDLRKLIQGKNVALGGASGVGKSTLMNALTGRDDIATGTVSDKTERGRHTTRHVEIFALDKETNLYDTPGFTSLEIPAMDQLDVRKFFPEIAQYQGYCRYSDCMHLKEPDCAVREALVENNIPESRYESYQAIIEEVKKWRK